MGFSARQGLIFCMFLNHKALDFQLYSVYSLNILQKLRQHKFNVKMIRMLTYAIVPTEDLKNQAMQVKHAS